MATTTRVSRGEPSRSRLLSIAFSGAPFLHLIIGTRSGHRTRASRRTYAPRVAAQKSQLRKRLRLTRPDLGQSIGATGVLPQNSLRLRRSRLAWRLTSAPRCRRKPALGPLYGPRELLPGSNAAGLDRNLGKS